MKYDQRDQIALIISKQTKLESFSNLYYQKEAEKVFEATSKKNDISWDALFCLRADSDNHRKDFIHHSSSGKLKIGLVYFWSYQNLHQKKLIHVLHPISVFGKHQIRPLTII